MQALKLLTHKLITLCYYIITVAPRHATNPYTLQYQSSASILRGMNLSTDSSSKSTVSTSYKLFSHQSHRQGTGKVTRSVWSPALKVLPVLSSLSKGSNSCRLFSLPLQAQHNQGDSSIPPAFKPYKSNEHTHTPFTTQVTLYPWHPGLL